jgi:hypothetical protein
MAKVVSYEELVEQAAEDIDAWRKLQAVHAMKVRGGTPEIRWSKRDGFQVVDAAEAPPLRRKRAAG